VAKQLKNPHLTFFSITLQLENVTEWSKVWQDTLVGLSTLSWISLPEFSHILPSSCLTRRFRHEAVSHASEIDLLSWCPSHSSSFHHGMAHLFCHANRFNEAVTCTNGALQQGSNATLTNTEAVLLLRKVSQKQDLYVHISLLQ